jgi:hypothetical protein
MSVLNILRIPIECREKKCAPPERLRTSGGIDTGSGTVTFGSLY